MPRLEDMLGAAFRHTLKSQAEFLNLDINNKQYMISQKMCMNQFYFNSVEYQKFNRVNFKDRSLLCHFMLIASIGMSPGAASLVAKGPVRLDVSTLKQFPTDRWSSLGIV